MIKENKTGRTLFDLIADFPKLSIPIVIILILLLGYFVIFRLTNISYSNGNLQINTKKTDTLRLVQTIFINKPDSIIKKPNKQNYNIKRDLDSKKIETNNFGQIEKQYNVNENKGVIGDNNTFNIGEQIPHIDEQIKSYLLSSLPNKKFPVNVISYKSCKNSERMAQEILEFLDKVGYDTRFAEGFGYPTISRIGFKIGFDTIQKDYNVNVFNIK